MTTDEEEQRDILARISFLEQKHGDKKRIGFDMIRKVIRGTTDNWHKLTLENT